MTSSTQTLSYFIDHNDLSMSVEWAESNPNMAADDWSRQASHYLCTIRNAEGATMAVPFSMGAAHTDEPSLEMVLDSLASDISSVVNTPDWLDWAEEMGITQEAYNAAALRQARESHRTIERQHEELRALLGDDALDVLLWNTERL